MLTDAYTQAVIPGVIIALKAIVISSVIWLPIVLVYLSLWLWLYYARAKWIKNLEWILLEIKLPKEVAKTPQAMEAVLMSMHVPVDAGNLIEKWFTGKLRSWSALEIVSLGGDIHFFIRTSKDSKNRVESAIYSQYPSVEVYEVPDYTENVPYGLPGSNWKIMGTEFKLDKPDAYPIKTYLDYGTDKVADVDDLSPVDSITPMIEFFGTLKPQEQIWAQFIIIATRDRFKKEKKWSEIWYQPSEWFKKQNWTEEAKAEIKKIREADSPKPKEGETQRLSFPTPGQTEVLKAVERTLGKPAFDCGIRTIYLAPEDVYNGVNVGGMISCFMQYNSASLNAFKLLNFTIVKYPWQDLTGRKLALKKAQMFDAYRRRSYFYPPYIRKQMVLSTEEIATMYHFPGKLAATPNLKKIESKRAEPPTNLPI
jgi:hypothetical protein